MTARERVATAGLPLVVARKNLARAFDAYERGRLEEAIAYLLLLRATASEAINFLSDSTPLAGRAA